MTTRRVLLRGALGAAAATALAPAVPASAAPAAPVGRRRFGSSSRITKPPTVGGDDAALHLLRRTTYGLTPALVADVRRFGASAWLDQQLQPASIDDSACDAVVRRFSRYFDDPPALHAALPFGSWDSMQATVQATFARACFSRRQLLEVMVELWSNHLNVTCPSSDVWSGKAWEDRHVIRPHALGRFSDMLVASAQSPAMLQYLDGASSRGSVPNENYGRELLELHTVGRESGFTQADVLACARALTGLSTWNPWNGGTAGNLGTFRYRADWHYTGPLSLLGWSHPNADPAQGVAVAISLLRHLAAHPATARRIARKLCVRFVADDPPAALVDRLAAVYLSSGTAIAPVLRALFASPEFSASAGRKYRRPYEDVVATVRALGIEPSSDASTKSFGDLTWELGQAGHAPLGWRPPDGYPDVAAAWLGTGTVLARWNLHVGLAQGWWKDGGLRYPGTLAQRLLGDVRPATRHALVTAVVERLLPATPLPAAHVDALVAFLGGAGATTAGDLDWQLPILIALVLDTPAWSTR